MPSIPVLQILSIVGLLQVFLSINGTLVIALGRPQDLLIIRLFSTAVILTAFIFVVNRGIVAVAWAYLICNYIIIAPIHFRLIFSLLEIDWKNYFKLFYMAIACVTVMVFIVTGVKQIDLDWLSSYGQLIFYVITGILVYVGSSYVMLPSLFSQLTAFVKQK
jgi:PST family polysaccharide transporter